MRDAEEAIEATERMLAAQKATKARAAQQADAKEEALKRDSQAYAMCQSEYKKMEHAKREADTELETLTSKKQRFEEVQVEQNAAVALLTSTDEKLAAIVAADVSPAEKPTRRKAARR